MQSATHKLTLANQGPNQPEVFYSIQGEGPETGRPSIFIRLSLCNLTCTWCDTPYTWNWDDKGFHHESGVRYSRNLEQSVLDFDDLTRRALNFPGEHFVITGGEPMVQQKRLEKWFAHHRERQPASRFDIETNATIVPTPAFDNFIALYVCSPKLANSGVAKSERIIPEAMRYFVQHERSVFKFVVESEADLSEIQELQAEFTIASSRIFLMPLGTDHATATSRHHWLAEQCLKFDYRFSPRLHLMLYGDRRGV